MNRSKMTEQKDILLKLKINTYIINLILQRSTHSYAKSLYKYIKKYIRNIHKILI